MALGRNRSVFTAAFGMAANTSPAVLLAVSVALALGVTIRRPVRIVDR